MNGTTGSCNHKALVLVAVEKYKKGEASLGRAAEVAGLPVGQMITVLKEFGVRSRIELEDYRQSLDHLGGWTTLSQALPGALPLFQRSRGCPILPQLHRGRVGSNKADPPPRRARQPALLRPGTLSIQIQSHPARKTRRTPITISRFRIHPIS